MTASRTTPTGTKPGLSSDPLDPRLNAWRPDLADSALRGRIEAARFVSPVRKRLSGFTPAAMRAAPGGDAVAISELLPGEAFDVIDEANGWAWGYSARDHYVGHVESRRLRPDDGAPTHRIAAPTALVFGAPDIKSPVIAALPLGALLTAADHDDRFMTLAGEDGGYVHRRHIAPVEACGDDPVAIAVQFLGTPYKWGGRSREGLDCSGLVQVALQACGIDAPRDSDMQAALGTDIMDAPRRRGDLVFFPGHVGLMFDEARLLHANAFHMSTVIEPLVDVLERLKPQYDRPITAARRL